MFRITILYDFHFCDSLLALIFIPPKNYFIHYNLYFYEFLLKAMNHMDHVTKFELRETAIRKNKK